MYSSAILEQQPSLLYQPRPEMSRLPPPCYFPQVPAQNFNNCTVNIYNAPVTQSGSVAASFLNHSSQAEYQDVLNGVDLDTILADF